MSNADSLFQVARSYAQENNYDLSLSILVPLVHEFPTNSDYSSYAARVYFWQGNAIKAKEYIDKNWNRESADAENLLLFIRISTVNQSYTDAINTANFAAQRFPDGKYDFLLLQAIAHEAAGNDTDAIEVINKIDKNALNYNGAQYIKTTILKKQKNMISASYLFTFFQPENIEPQHLAYIEYKRNFKKFTQLFRVNYANMFKSDALQFETDSYIKLKHQDYIYLNVGLAPKQNLFPQYRGGAEYFKDFNKTIGASLGARFLYFNSTNSTFLLTGHFAYNVKSFTFNYRPFVALGIPKTLVSHVFYARKNNYNKESYLQLDLQYGALPYFTYTVDLVTRLNAYRVGTSGKIRIKDNFFVQPALLYEYEEYVPNTYRNRFIAHVILSQRF